MLTQLIYDWAERTPDKTAILYNGKPLSFGSFADQISLARGYFASRGCEGTGYAVMAIGCMLDFWVLSLALRSLGLTTVAVPSVESVGKLQLPDIRCVVTSSVENWNGLDELCATQGLNLLTVSLAGASALGLQEGPQFAPGGHVLQTSGTTGNYKLLLMDPASDALFMRRKVNVIGFSQDTVLCVFDYGAWTGVGYRWAASPLSIGGTIVIDQGREPYRALLRPEITHAVLVPSALAAILAAPAGAFPRSETMQLTVGGGAVSWA